MKFQKHQNSNIKIVQLFADGKNHIFLIRNLLQAKNFQGKIIKGMNDLMKDEDPSALDFPIEIVFYIAIAVIFLMIIALMMKLLWNWDDDINIVGETMANETSGLLPSKVDGWFISYGTSEEEEDIESSFNRSCNSSSDDLYDAKICVICFDDQRSCLFIPCGHCISCYNCAKRIITEEIKSCPICRTYIDKVKELHIL